MQPHLGKDYNVEPVDHNSMFGTRNSKETLDEYQERLRKLQAQKLFDMYIDLINILQRIEPELVRQAIKVLKTEKEEDFELANVEHMRKLYPEDVPDVYTRVWVSKQSAKEKTILNYMT